MLLETLAPELLPATQLLPPPRPWSRSRNRVREAKLRDMPGPAPAVGVASGAALPVPRVGLPWRDGSHSTDKACDAD